MEKNHNIEVKHFILIVFYLLVATYMSVMYYQNLDNNMVLYSIFFLLTVVLNRLIYHLERNDMPQKERYVMYSTEAFFMLYALFVFIWGESYFTTYRLLILPSIIWAIIQSFKINRAFK